MNKWFLTENGQLLDLQFFRLFWIEQLASHAFVVFVKNEIDIFHIAEFTSEKESIEYLEQIKEFLEKFNA